MRACIRRSRLVDSCRHSDYCERRDAGQPSCRWCLLLVGGSRGLNAEASHEDCGMLQCERASFSYKQDQINIQWGSSVHKVWIIQRTFSIRFAQRARTGVVRGLVVPVTAHIARNFKVIALCAQYLTRKVLAPSGVPLAMNWLITWPLASARYILQKPDLAPRRTRSSSRRP